MLLPTDLARDEALRALDTIRAAVDRTTRYSTFSALSGFLAGGAALVGSGAFGLWAAWPGAHPEIGITFLYVWLGVFGFAAASLWICTSLKARSRGEPLWTPIAKTALSALMGPGAAGAIGTAALVMHGQFLLLPGLWLMLYGCGLYVVSFFAPLFLRALGLVFMTLGLAAWWLPAHAALWLGLGFGLLHGVFGVVVLTRYRR